MFAIRSPSITTYPMELIKMELLAQMLPTPPELPDWRWWADMGVLGIFAFVVITALVTVFFIAWLPYYVRLLKQRAEFNAQKAIQEANYSLRKQELDLLKDEKLNALMDTIRDNAGEELQHKRQQTAILDRMDKRQSEHADSCATAHDLTTKIHKSVEEIRENVVRITPRTA